MKSFWNTLPKPFTVLAPMEDVTDTVFRQIVASCAAPDVFFTEFTSVDGLNSRGRDAVSHRFDYTESERPIVAQVWGTSPELFYRAARFILDLKFDGMDINMGCPEKSVTSRGAGACLIDDPPRVTEIIAAARDGLNGSIPLSVKTRLGYKKPAPDWMPFLLDQGLDAITVHGRTAAELSRVPARWDEIGMWVGLRDQMKIPTVIIGNGDAVNYNDAADKRRLYGVDGVMIGRGVFHDLWAFARDGVSHMDDRGVLSRIAMKHIRLFDETWGSTKNFAVMKKFFKMYVHGFPDAGAVRERLMRANSRMDVEAIIHEYD